MAVYAMPTDPEERESWRRDPAAYTVIERLHDASEELAAAIDEQTVRTGQSFAVQHEPERSCYREDQREALPERLAAARSRVKAAEEEWVLAVTAADALLARRIGGSR